MPYIAFFFISLLKLKGFLQKLARPPTLTPYLDVWLPPLPAPKISRNFGFQKTYIFLLKKCPKTTIFRSGRPTPQFCTRGPPKIGKNWRFLQVDMPNSCECCTLALKKLEKLKVFASRHAKFVWVLHFRTQKTAKTKCFWRSTCQFCVSVALWH